MHIYTSILVLRVWYLNFTIAPQWHHSDRLIILSATKLQSKEPNICMSGEKSQWKKSVSYHYVSCKTLFHILIKSKLWHYNFSDRNVSPFWNNVINL